jgi:hypothetical protein
MNAHITIFPSTNNARDHWRRQSIVDGTDWTTLGRATARVFWRLQLTSSVCWSTS